MKTIFSSDSLNIENLFNFIEFVESLTIHQLHYFVDMILDVIENYILAEMGISPR